MTVEYALNLIKNELSFRAKRDIVEKYNALDSEIKDFEFKRGDEFYRHPFSLIDENSIIERLYTQMLTICVSQVPIKLLVKKGSGEDIIRNFNRDFDIKKPKKIEIGGDIELDEPLALASVYDTLDSFGLSEFKDNARDILNEYERSVVIPDGKDISNLAFRFSPDKSSWHSSYQSGDNYFSIYQFESWSEPIPLISGNGGGASNLTDLKDFPKTHQKGKILVSTGLRLEWADMPKTSSNNTNTANEPNITPTSSALREITYSEGLELNDDTFILLKLTKNDILKIKQSPNFEVLMKEKVEYKFIVELNSFSLGFDANLTLMHNNPSFTKIENSTHATFNMIRLDAGIILVYNINYGSY